MNNFLEIGQIVNTKGLKGEVKVNSYSEDPKRFEKIKTILIKQKGKGIEYEIEKVTYTKNQVVLKLKDIDTIEEAEKLRNSLIFVNREQLGELPKNVYYIADLIGLDVITEDNIYLGKVDDIFSTKSNDVYVIKDDLGKTKLLPGIPEVIKEISLESEKIIVHLIEGL
ncbi:MAG: 16S rRNA processing protein RimM [Clostridia bacterium]|nr:16S rRNA processing protein RimM [Clostridia bacterium]